jgi:hypothetical protein
MTPTGPPPWSVEDIGACFVVKDSTGQKLAAVYYEEKPGRRSGNCARPGGSADVGKTQWKSCGRTVENLRFEAKLYTAWYLFRAPRRRTRGTSVIVRGPALQDNLSGAVSLCVYLKLPHKLNSRSVAQ